MAALRITGSIEMPGDVFELGDSPLVAVRLLLREKRVRITEGDDEVIYLARIAAGLVLHDVEGFDVDALARLIEDDEDRRRGRRRLEPVTP